MFRQRGIFARPAVPAQPHHAEESLGEDAARHLRRALAAVHEDDRHLLDLEADLVGGELHLNLEGVALEANLVKLDGLQHAAADTVYSSAM
mgnify:CR=1 FL=1